MFHGRKCIFSLQYMFFFCYLNNTLHRSWDTNRKKFWPLGETEFCFTLKTDSSLFRLFIVVVVTKVEQPRTTLLWWSYFFYVTVLKQLTFLKIGYLAIFITNFRHLFLIIVDYIILSNTPSRDTRKPEQICIHLSVLES